MNIWVFDLDGVLQEPAYPHPKLLKDVSGVVGRSYSDLYDHYTGKFAGNEAEERYHLSLCVSEEQKESVRAFWKKLHDNMMQVEIIPGAADLLRVIADRREPLYAWTKGEGTERIQRRRLSSIGLAQFFPEGLIFSSPRKGTLLALEQDLFPHLPDGRVVLIGDRFRQDIEPALNLANITCVWVREEHSDEPISGFSAGDFPNLHIVGSTQELITLVKEGALDE